MYKLEKGMIENLIDLRVNHKVVGLKFSFEDEGSLRDESNLFMRVAHKASVPVSIKVGGCDARKNIQEAWNLGAVKIVAPMVETPYALKLYINALNAVCPDWQDAGIKAYINVETITACQNLDAMLEIPEAKYLSGCVVGRVDLVGSLNMPRSAVNTDEIFKLTYAVADKMKSTGKDFLIGGSISIEAMDFLNKLPENALKYFETRNVIFDVSAMEGNIALGLTKAMKFELDWLMYKQKKYAFLANRDVERIKMMSERYEKNLQQLS